MSSLAYCHKRWQPHSLTNPGKHFSCHCAFYPTWRNKRTQLVPLAAADANSHQASCQHGQHEGQNCHIEYTPFWKTGKPQQTYRDPLFVKLFHVDGSQWIIWVVSSKGHLCCWKHLVRLVAEQISQLKQHMKLPWFCAFASGTSQCTRVLLT